MIAWTVIVSGCLLLAGVVALLRGARRAPLGYEDERGFFEGLAPQSDAPELIMGTRVTTSAGPALATDAEGLGSYLDVEPWPREGQEAQPGLSAGSARPHVHSVR